jgi:hypothetical protein
MINDYIDSNLKTPCLIFRKKIEKKYYTTIGIFENDKNKIIFNIKNNKSFFKRKFITKNFNEMRNNISDLFKDKEKSNISNWELKNDTIERIYSSFNKNDIYNLNKISQEKFLTDNNKKNEKNNILGFNNDNYNEIPRLKFFKTKIKPKIFKMTKKISLSNSFENKKTDLFYENIHYKNNHIHYNKSKSVNNEIKKIFKKNKINSLDVIFPREELNLSLNYNINNNNIKEYDNDNDNEINNNHKNKNNQKNKNNNKNKNNFLSFNLNDNDNGKNNNSEIICFICEADSDLKLNRRKIFYSNECNHFICNLCGRAYFEKKIEENDYTTKCLFFKCNKLISFNIIKNLISEKHCKSMIDNIKKILNEKIKIKENSLVNNYINKNKQKEKEKEKIKIKNHRNIKNFSDDYDDIDADESEMINIYMKLIVDKNNKIKNDIEKEKEKGEKINKDIIEFKENFRNKRNIIKSYTSVNTFDVFFEINKMKKKICVDCNENSLFTRYGINIIKCLNCFNFRCKYCYKNIVENHLNLNGFNYCKVFYARQMRAKNLERKKFYFNKIHSFLMFFLSYILFIFWIHESINNKLTIFFCSGINKKNRNRIINCSLVLFLYLFYLIFFILLLFFVILLIPFYPLVFCIFEL